MQYKSRFPADFSLAELFISLSVLGILAVAAYPSYTEYSLRNKLTDATTTLAKLRRMLEVHHQTERSYLNNTQDGCALKPISTAYFDFACIDASDQGFTITASSKPYVELGSGGRYEFTVNQDGQRKTLIFAGSLVNADCWMSSRNGC